MSKGERAQKVPAIFGQRIKREREQRGWSMRQLAAESGVAGPTVMHTEDGKDAALSTAIAITAVLGLSLDALLAEPQCARCDGEPPAGFICSACGRAA